MRSDLFERLLRISDDLHAAGEIYPAFSTLRAAALVAEGNALERVLLHAAHRRDIAGLKFDADSARDEQARYSDLIDGIAGGH